MFDDLKQDNQPVPAAAPIPQNPAVSPTPAMPQAPVAPAPQAGGIDDMFGDVDPVSAEHGPVAPDKPSAIQSGKIKPVSQTNLPVSEPLAPTQAVPSPQAMPIPQKMTTANIPPADSMMVSDDRSGGMMRKIIVAVLVIVLLAASAGAVYYFFLRNNGTELDPDQNSNTNTTIDDNNNQNENTNEITDEPVINEDDLDDDFDGLSNGLERIYGTNPLETDTDNDGVHDQDEVEVYKTDPLADDSDNDGLGDYEEIRIYGTDPNDPDTDGDTYQDGAEVSNGYNPLGIGKLEDGLGADNTNTNEGGL